MVGEDPFTTVHCLRGRLQAERAASRAAEHNANLMAIRLKELEKQLKIEAKARRKAQKKLIFLQKKLQYLNIPFPQGIDASALSSNNSCTSSMASTSLDDNQEHEDLLLDPQMGSKSTSITEIQLQHPTTAHQFCHGYEESRLEKKSEEDGKEEKQDEVEKMMGLVPVPVPVPVSSIKDKDKPDVEVKTQKVREVLHRLNQIRQILQTTLDKRRIIKVG